MANSRIVHLLALLILGSSIVLVVAAAAPAATKLSPDAEKAISGLDLELKNATNLVASAAPPAKQKETLRAIEKHVQVVNSALAKAKESGDEKQIIRIYFTVRIAAVMISNAPADKKLMMMEDQFNSVATPIAADCPAVDKAYCEMSSKVQKAVEGVFVGTMTKEERASTTLGEKVMFPAKSTINEAYAEGDEKKIARVLAAYSKAADEVIAAAPADKLKVLERTFAAATASLN